MTEALQKLIENGGWRDISEAPTDKRMLIKTPDDEIFAATWVQNFIDGDVAWAIAALDCEDGSQDRVIVRNPTHFMPLDTAERMAEVIEVLIEGLKGLRNNGDKITEVWAQEALAKANEIAEGK
jgi:hypothetical protein